MTSINGGGDNNGYYLSNNPSCEQSVVSLELFPGKYEKESAIIQFVRFLQTSGWPTCEQNKTEQVFQILFGFSSILTP